MIATMETDFNEDELLHLALNSMQESDREQAMLHLKKLIARNPKNGKALFLLGSLHADIGMYDLAIEELSEAVRNEPGIAAAHFQLGLLYATSGNIAEAEKAWAIFDREDENNPYLLFKRGILHLANNRFEECLRDLRSGIQNNLENLPLNQNMQQLIDAVEADLNNPLQSREQDGSPQKQGSHILLSAYNQDNYDDDS